MPSLDEFMQKYGGRGGTQRAASDASGSGQRSAGRTESAPITTTEQFMQRYGGMGGPSTARQTPTVTPSTTLTPPTPVPTAPKSPEVHESAAGVPWVSKDPADKAGSAPHESAAGVPWESKDPERAEREQAAASAEPEAEKPEEDKRSAPMNFDPSDLLDISMPWRRGAQTGEAPSPASPSAAAPAPVDVDALTRQRDAAQAELDPLLEAAEKMETVPSMMQMDINRRQEQIDGYNQQLAAAGGTAAEAPAKTREELKAEVDTLSGELARLAPGLRSGKVTQEEYDAKKAELDAAKEAYAATERSMTVGEHLDSAVTAAMTGLERAGLGVTNALDWLLGENSAPWWLLNEVATLATGQESPLSGLNPITNLKNRGEQEVQWWANQAAEKAEGNTAAEAISRHTQSIAQTLPFVLLNVMSAGMAGTAAAGTTAGLEYTAAINAAPGMQAVSTMASKAMADLATNPTAQYSFVSTFGGSYDEALQDGASPTEASIYAMLNATFGTIVEMGGGGMEGLPDKVADALKTGKREIVLDWAKSIVGEVGEEELQGLLERGLGTFYNDAPWFSLDDPNAVINPGVMWQTAKDTAIDTAIMGAGQTALQRGMQRAGEIARSRAEAARGAAAQQAEAGQAAAPAAAAAEEAAVGDPEHIGERFFAGEFAGEETAPQTDAAQILADVATGQQAQEAQQAEPGTQVDAAQLLADLTTGQENTEPSQVNIDNAAGSEYTGANETNLSEVTENEPGRSDEDSAGEMAAGGTVLEALPQSGAETDGGALSAGVVRVSEDLSAAYEESGVVDYGLKDSSNDSAAYSSALEEGRNSDPEHGWMVTPQTAEQLSGKTMLLSDGGAIGVVITSDGDIEGVFKNKNKHKGGGALMTLLPQAIEHGGTKLDCYGEGLANLYAQYGFIPVARVEFNEKYANPGWDESKGRPFVYVMMHNGDSASDVVRNRRGHNYALYTNAELEALPFYDKNSYGAACQYRDSLLEEQNRNRAESRQELADEREGIPAPATISETFNTGSEALNTAQNAEAQTESAQERAAGGVGPYTGGSMTGGGGNAPASPGGEGTQPGMKRSRTESNTLSGVAEKLGGEQESLYYVPTSERQTLTEAVNRVSADRVGEMQALMDKEMWNAADIDTGLTLYGLLKAESLRSGDNTAANAWAKIVQERGTRSGQALQAFSKWTRSAAASAVKAQEQLDAARQEGKISPEEAQRIGNDIYGFAQELDAIGDGDLTSLRELIERQSDYRGTGTFFKRIFMEELNEVEDFDWLREYATRQLMNMADDVTVTADLGQKLKTWQVNSQLTRLGTFFRNIGGNVVFGVQDTLTQDGLGVALDMLVSKFTGKRAVGVDKSWFSSKARKGAHDAMVRSILEVAGDVDMTGQGSRYGTTANRTFKMNGSGFERFMSRWEQLLGYSLTTSDRVSRGQIETAVQEGLEGFDLTEEERAELGETMADYRLFQNKDTAYKLSKGIHDVLNILGIGGEVNGVTRTGGFGVGDLINTYPGVPANLGVKALEYSPANIVKGGVELFQLLKNVKHDKITTADGKTGERVSSWTAAQQQKAVMDVARGFAGVPMIVLLTALFKSGLAKNADDEEDPDAAAQKRAEGRTGVQVNLDAALRAFKGESGEWKDGDDLLSIGWLEPMNAFMAIASMIAEGDGEDATLSSYAKDYFAGSVQGVLEMPVMQNIANVVNTFRYSTADNLGEKVTEAAVGLLGDALIGTIPAPLKQYAKDEDEYTRDVSGDSAIEKVWNNLRNALPGLRYTLPIKTDNFGNPRLSGTGDNYQDWLNNWIRPGAVGKMSQTETSAAVERLYEATGDATVYPDRSAPTSFKIGGERYRMNAEERRTYHNTYGKLVEQYTGELLLGDGYSDFSDAERVELIGSFKQYANYKAKQEYMEAHGEPYADPKWVKVEDLMDSGISMVDALTWKEQADTDGNGSLSQSEVYDWLIDSDHTDQQKEVLWGTMGWKKNWADYLASLASKEK